MKNIHLIPTDKPSRLFEILQFNFVFDNQNKYSEEYKKLHKYKNQNIYITNSEEIKINEPYLGNDNNIYYLCEGGVNFKGKKVILTTDNQLIKNGVQTIDDEFLEWFVKNPSCEEVELEVDLSKHNGQFQTKYGWKIIIPEEEPKQEQTKCYCGHTITCDCGPLEEPKQKAEQIVEHFDEILTYLESKNKVKLCALFLVNQLKDVAPYEDNNKAGWILDKQTIRYWKEVEQEINKL